MARAPFIRCDAVGKAFGPTRVIDNLSLDIFKGEFVSLLGPSGSGKTTLLTLIAGFERPTEGGIWLDGYRIDDLAPHRRDMGVVFQNYALFPHMTVAENVGFPLRMRRVSKADAQARVLRALEMVELSHLAARHPGQLSGGQQQRVALARALVFEPRVVLMDEPLGALDKRLREQMQLDIRDLHRRLGLTIVFVTHDQSEALTMSDRIAVFNNGRIEQIDTPDTVYDRPTTRFVAEFIGETNLLPGQVTEGGAAGSTVRLSGGTLVRVAQPLEPGRAVSVCLRPERLGIGAQGANALTCRVTDRVYMGDHLRVALDGPMGPIVARLPRSADGVRTGGTLTASFAPDDCWVLAA
ncbi:ABC transporter ATP-binding protein [Falsirhodobacter halotolerans]|uniref:ABC transporter ATP-binding protein n=1 Tax=Falsirhodobacter halotolerans TaxID=1146892 RepID=UPI001FD0D300|nr:ABC transporter ATP-binding protein [Falsirhodobacter halotolerans]MCJ8141235.1 ABC transporter ATP-binding protein [Falsirhodobacter halotolerans]